MSWVNHKKEIESLAKTFDKSIKLHTKDNLISKAIAWILFVVSFGASKREEFLERFATTIGNHHFYPAEWSKLLVLSVLPHEARHTTQYKWFGLWIHPMLGLPLMALFYIFLPIPIGFAFCRLFLEIDADKQKWIFYAKNSEFGKTVTNRIIKEQALRRAYIMSSSSYLWTTPNPISKHYYLRAYNKVAND